MQAILWSHSYSVFKFLFESLTVGQKGGNLQCECLKNQKSILEGHSKSTSLVKEGGGGGGGRKSDTGGRGGSKKSDNSHSNFVGFSFCAAQFFLLCISWSFDNITLSYNKKIIQ